MTYRPLMDLWSFALFRLVSISWENQTLNKRPTVSGIASPLAFRRAAACLWGPCLSGAFFGGPGASLSRPSGSAADRLLDKCAPYCPWSGRCSERSTPPAIRPNAMDDAASVVQFDFLCAGPRIAQCRIGQ